MLQLPTNQIQLAIESESVTTMVDYAYRRPIFFSGVATSGATSAGGRHSHRGQSHGGSARRGRTHRGEGCFDAAPGWDGPGDILGTWDIYMI